MGADGNVLKFGRATVTFVVDWESDGDLDIVSGDIDGSISLLRNTSGDKTLKWGEVEKLEAGGARIKTGGGNSGPVCVDWDGDGKRDLVVGCGDGAVLFFRNTAEGGEPVLAKGETLVPMSHTYAARDPEVSKGSAHGYRAKLAVVDWNGDGKMDLLVGDVNSVVGKEPELTEEQKKQREELLAKQKELQGRMQPFFQHWSKQYETWYAKVRREMGLDTELPTREFFETLKGDTRNKFFEAVRKLQSEDPKFEEYQALQKESRELRTALRPFQPTRRTGGNVWLYARK